MPLVSHFRFYCATFIFQTSPKGPIRLSAERAGTNRGLPGPKPRVTFPSPEKCPTRPKSRRHAAVGLVSARLRAGEKHAKTAQAALSWPSANSPCQGFGILYLIGFD